MDLSLDQIVAFVSKYSLLAYDLLSQPPVFIQLGIIAAVSVTAIFVARIVEPRLEKQARKIKGMPGLLRVIAVILRRLNWLFFAILLAIAYAAMSVTEWPGRTYLVYSAAVLSGAWLLITAVSMGIRSRFLGQLFSIVVWVFVAAEILGIVEEVTEILDSAALEVANVRISILGLIEGGLFIGGLLWLSLSAGNFFDSRIQKLEELTPSLRVLIGKILRILLIVVALLVAMSGLGIDLTAFTVLSGAVGVGLGFGLQKVVSNFISGIIILLDQSIKPGDTITLGETFGWIRELRARFVSVVTRDGREFLIPNEDFVTQEVINWSFSDQYVRLDVPFGVSYDSDPHEVTRLAIGAAKTIDRVDKVGHTPVCWLTAFGDSSLDFLLRFWIKDPKRGLTNVRGQVMLALWDTFKENDIAIPYPHREVIMKTPADGPPAPLPDTPSD